EDAELQTLAVFRDSTAMERDTLVDPKVIGFDVTARNYYAAVDAMGSPVPGQTAAGLNALPADAVDGTLGRVFRPALSSGPEAGSLTCGAGLTRLDLEIASGDQMVLEISESAPVKLYAW